MLDKFNVYNLKLNRLAPDLRWFSFREGKQWIGEDTNSVVSFIFAYASKSQLIDSVEIFSSESALVDAKINILDTIPEGYWGFPSIPNEQKIMTEVSIEYPGTETLSIFGVSGTDKFKLFTLSPSIEFPQFIFDILSLYGDRVSKEGFVNLVETGTLFAHTTIPASFWFENVYSIELSEELLRKAKSIKQPNNNIEFILGDSAQALPVLLPKLQGPTMFFLDAHWSGDQSVDWKNSKFKGFPASTSHRGDNSSDPTSVDQVPLLEELDCILSNYSECCLIIIDDWNVVGSRGQGFAGEDWSHISKQEIKHKLDAKSRTIFHLEFDPKHYLIGLSHL